MMDNKTKVMQYNCPIDMDLFLSGDAIVPLAAVVEASKQIWNEYVIGFFLDKPLSYMAMINHLKKI